jgi:hypothetical protein
MTYSFSNVTQNTSFSRMANSRTNLPPWIWIPCRSEGALRNSFMCCPLFLENVGERHVVMREVVEPDGFESNFILNQNRQSDNSPVPFHQNLFHCLIRIIPLCVFEPSKLNGLNQTRSILKRNPDGKSDYPKSENKLVFLPDSREQSR